MKKHSKKWRKIQKEKEIRRANTKVGESFSKAKTKKNLCLHYIGVPSGFIVGNCHSLLESISDIECRCSVCHQVFPIEKVQQMDNLITYLNTKGCTTEIKIIANLSRGIEPVYYRRLSENETEIIDTITDKIVLSRHTGIL